MAKTELQRAIEDGDVERTRALLAARPEDARGGVNLHLAAAAPERATELVEALLAAGADVDARDAHGMTALHHAIGANRAAADGARVIEVLVRAGADVEAQGQYGWTPLLYAVERGEVEEVEALLDAGARVDVVYPDESPGFARGLTLLGMARADRAKVELLRRAGAS